MPSRYSQTKDLFLRFLARQAQYHPQMNAQTLPSGFPEFAAQEGLTLGAHDQNDVDMVHDIFWDLAGSGLVRPGSRGRNPQDNSLPWLCITDYGLACVEEGKILPVDSEAFLEEMDLASLDDVIRLYIEESVRAFSSRGYLAAAVMAGGALERAILIMTEKYLDKIPKTKQKSYQTDVLSAQKIKTRFDHFLKFIEDNGIKKTLPRATQETLDSLFPAIVNLIRITRNDVGHPTGREIERDEAEALIYLLKTAIKFVYKFIE